MFFSIFYFTQICQDIVCDPKLSFIFHFISLPIDYSSSHSDHCNRSIAPIFHPSCVHTLCHITLQCSPILREMYCLTPWLVQPCQQAEQCELIRGLEEYLHVLVCSVASLWLPLTHAWAGLLQAWLAPVTPAKTILDQPTASWCQVAKWAQPRIKEWPSQCQIQLPNYRLASKMDGLGWSCRTHHYWDNRWLTEQPLSKIQISSLVALFSLPKISQSVLEKTKSIYKFSFFLIKLCTKKHSVVHYN